MANTLGLSPVAALYTMAYPPDSFDNIITESAFAQQVYSAVVEADTDGCFAQLADAFQAEALAKSREMSVQNWQEAVGALDIDDLRQRVDALSLSSMPVSRGAVEFRNMVNKLAEKGILDASNAEHQAFIERDLEKCCEAWEERSDAVYRGGVFSYERVERRLDTMLADNTLPRDNLAATWLERCSQSESVFENRLTDLHLLQNLVRGPLDLFAPYEQPSFENFRWFKCNLDALDAVEESVIYAQSKFDTRKRAMMWENYYHDEALQVNPTAALAAIVEYQGAVNAGKDVPLVDEDASVRSKYLKACSDAVRDADDENIFTEYCDFADAEAARLASTSPDSSFEAMFDKQACIVLGRTHLGFAVPITGVARWGREVDILVDAGVFDASLPDDVRFPRMRFVYEDLQSLVKCWDANSCHGFDEYLENSVEACDLRLEDIEALKSAYDHAPLGDCDSDQMAFDGDRDFAEKVRAKAVYRDRVHRAQRVASSVAQMDENEVELSMTD